MCRLGLLGLGTGPIWRFSKLVSRYTVHEQCTADCGRQHARHSNASRVGGGVVYARHPCGLVVPPSSRGRLGGGFAMTAQRRGRGRGTSAPCQNDVRVRDGLRSEGGQTAVSAQLPDALTPLCISGAPGPLSLRPNDACRAPGQRRLSTTTAAASVAHRAPSVNAHRYAGVVVSCRWQPFAASAGVDGCCGYPPPQTSH